jgi:uncharacterized membrane protein
MLLTAVAMGILGIAIYRGKTDLIHDYHQTKVTDKKAYGRAFGKAMMVVSAAPLISGIIGLFGENEKVAKISVCALFIGLSIGIALIIAVQKKYNNGIF